MDQEAAVQKYIAEQTFLTRRKDFTNPFRRITFESDLEMTAVLGSAEEDPFVKQIRKETQDCLDLIKSVAKRG